jgi:hypothetical protein
MACSRVVLVKLTKLVIASSVGSEAMLSSSALKPEIKISMYKHANNKSK